MMRRRSGRDWEALLGALVLSAAACSSKSTSYGIPTDGGAGTAGAAAGGGATGGSAGAGGGTGGSGAGGTGGSSAGGTNGRGTGGTAGSSAGGSNGTGTGGTNGTGTGGTAGAGGTGGGGFSCQAVAQVQCARLAACYPFAVTSAYGTEQKCVTAVAAECTNAMAAPGAQPPTTSNCAQKMQAVACEQLYGGGWPEECRFKGTRADAARCVYGSQCSTGLCSRPITQTGGTFQCGTCVSYVAENGPCSNTSLCSPGTQCIGMRCMRDRLRGQMCTGAQGCAYPLACINGTCNDPLPVGASCDAAANACNSAAGHFCGTGVGGSSVCQAFQVVGAGQSCPYQNGVIVLCSGDSMCSNFTMTCVPRPTLGQSCSDPNLSCVHSTECIRGECAYPDPALCN